MITADRARELAGEVQAVPSKVTETVSKHIEDAAMQGRSYITVEKDVYNIAELLGQLYGAGYTVTENIIGVITYLKISWE